MLASKRLKYRPLEDSDIDVLYDWHNNILLTKYSLNSFVFPQTLDDCLNFIKKQKDGKTITFGIVHEDILIGYLGFSGINWINRSAEFFIFIGDSSKWRKGFGFESGSKLLEYGFDDLQLHRIELTVSEPNVAAIKLYKKLNFVQEGIKRDSCYRNGSFHNKILMSLLISDFRNYRISGKK